MFPSKKSLHDALVALIRAERRFDPFYRTHFDALFRAPLGHIIQALINLQRNDEGYKLADERALPNERAAVDAIVADLTTFMRREYEPGKFERADHTKTHGIVRAEFTVRDHLPDSLRHGLFAHAKTYRAWVRFSGPGPESCHDIETGLLGMSVKVMGVAGRKLCDDERHTQDFLAISTPTFSTPDIHASVRLQDETYVHRTPLFYYLNRADPRLLDLLMQALFRRTQTSPLECDYHSCTPYLIGEAQAMQYALRSQLRSHSKIPHLPLRPPAHYLRENMAATLLRQDVEFDLLVQLQTDAHRMPIEDATVRWPEHLSPFLPVATLRIARQVFDTPAQLRFGSSLRFSPWHCLPEHRPLGNQNRARRRVYAELARLRQTMNRTPHYEPTGDEVFDESNSERPPSRPVRVIAD